MADFSFDTGSENNGNGNGASANPVGIGIGGKDSGVGSETNGNAGSSNTGARDASDIAGKIEPKRRGRKPLPRDAAGNIIRDAPTGSPNAGNKTGLDLGGFKPNDRRKVREQIQGMHTAVAVLTKQPVFMLADQEAIALTEALCDVLDYHNINIVDGTGPYGLYITLLVTVFGIYKPRVDILASGGKIVGVAPSAPTSEGEARQRNNGAGMMDFSGDVGTQH